MKVQSASLDVPGNCPNQCKFCVSELWRKNNLNMLNNVFKFDSDDITDWVQEAFCDRLIYLKQMGINTLIFTGTYSEPLFNEKYLKLFDEVNRQTFGKDKFVNIEVQTSGVGLTKKRIWLASTIGVKTISLSLASFDTDTNFKIMRTPKKLRTWKIDEICKKIKEVGFNLRLILNMNLEGYKDCERTGWDEFWHHKYNRLLNQCQKLGADQVTFRKLYSTNEDSEITTWINANRMDISCWWKQLNQYIQEYGKQLNRLSFGAMRYSINGMSTVVDEDCMAKDGDKENLRHLILRRNCRLYSEWDDPASLIF